MSLIGYCTCHIQFVPNNKELPERQYSDRSIIELRQVEIKDYSIRAVDIENNKTEIFNFSITDHDQYQLGVFDSQPDIINDLNGTYYLWLNEDSRGSFHDIMCAIFEILFPDELMDISSESVNTNSVSEDFPERKESSISDPINCDPKDILNNVRNLSRFIKQGNGDEAARMATELVSQGVRLQTKSLKQLQNEEVFRIFVQFDGNEYGLDQNGGTIPVDVFPSTTIRELRAAFEIAYHYCPTSEYFFVNGHLAHDHSAMRDLNVGPNSLFILFLITYPKQFQTNGPWKCPSCSTQNQQNNLKCFLCLASRIE